MEHRPATNQNQVGAIDISVQHVNKKCSDELLRKFTDSDNDMDDGNKLELVIRAPKRRKSSSLQRVRPGELLESCESPINCGRRSSMVERRSLLPVAARKRSSAQLTARDLRHKSLLGAIQKTWRKTVEGASRVFMEKHYNQHRRLISESAV